MNDEKNSTSTQADGKTTQSAPCDERFADPQTDIDPRTSDEGMTSIGGYDVNADSLPSETPGVRQDGDEKIEKTSSSVNTDLSGDIMDSNS